MVRRLLRNRERPNLEAAAELIDWYRALGGRAGTRHAIAGPRDLCVLGWAKRPATRGMSRNDRLTGGTVRSAHEQTTLHSDPYRTE